MSFGDDLVGPEEAADFEAGPSLRCREVEPEGRPNRLFEGVERSGLGRAFGRLSDVVAEIPSEAEAKGSERSLPLPAEPDAPTPERGIRNRVAVGVFGVPLLPNVEFGEDPATGEILGDFSPSAELVGGCASP